MTMIPTNQTPSECRHYKNGWCEYHLPYHRCCMRIVKPMTECFYYQPKEKKDNDSRTTENN